MACLHQFIRPQCYGMITKPNQVRIDEIMPPRQLNVQVSTLRRTRKVLSDQERRGMLKLLEANRYAVEMAEKLGIKGWIMLNKRGVCRGQIEGEKDKVDEFALWLRLQGSPGARIEHAEFKNWQIIDALNYRNFSVRF